MDEASTKTPVVKDELSHEPEDISVDMATDDEVTRASEAFLNMCKAERESSTGKSTASIRMKEFFARLLEVQEKISYDKFVECREKFRNSYEAWRLRIPVFARPRAWQIVGRQLTQFIQSELCVRVCWS